MSFQIHALPAETFQDLFALPDKTLQHIGAARVIATSNPGFPCRVSLQDAEIGDELILANYVHLPETSPYKSSHAIYVRKGVAQRMPDVGETPAVLTRRLLSVRGFGVDHMMKAADVVDGKDLGSTLTSLFGDQDIHYVHIHNAKPGCFAAKATRVP